MLSDGHIGSMRGFEKKLAKQAALMKASKENPGAESEARAKGIAVGKRIRYVTDGVEHYGVVRSLHPRSVVIELSATGMMTGGEDIIVREDEIPFAGVCEILGDGRLAQPKPEKQSAPPMAPKRERPYATCDFCDQPIHEVERIKGRGLVALCREHAKGPTDEEPVPFKFKLGLKYETWHAWPKPTEQELADRETTVETRSKKTGPSPPRKRYGRQPSQPSRTSRRPSGARRPRRRR